MIEDSITIDEIKDNEGNAEFFGNKLISIEDMFEYKDKIILKGKRLEQFLNGVKLECNLPNGICRIYNEKSMFLGLGEVKENKLKRDVII